MTCVDLLVAKIGCEPTQTTTDIRNITTNNNDINNSIRNQINQDCRATLTQSNTINIVGSTVKRLSATQKNSLDTTCILQSILKSKTSAEVVNKLLDEIKNNVKTSGSLIGSSANNNTIATNTTNNSTKIDNSKFNEISKQCIMNMKQQNLLNIIGSNVEDSTTDQANAGFMRCMSQHSDDTMISASDLSDTTHITDNTTETQGGDVLKSAGDGVGNAAKGIGQGVGDGVKAVGEGITNFLSGYTYPILISSVCLSIVLLVVFYLMMQDPEAVKSLSETARSSYR